MPAYHYMAMSVIGVEQKGVIEADNVKHARQLLRDKSLLPIHLYSAQEKHIAKTSNWRHLLGRRLVLSSKELALFTRQFATLLAAGLPIETALAAVGEQTEKPHVQGLVLSVRAKVTEGHALAEALREFPHAFSPLFTATIAAGERSGHLDQVLLRLAEYTEQQWQMRQKLKTALIYPLMIVLIALGIVSFLLVYVVPKMVAVYAGVHQRLPLLTEILIWVSDGARLFGGYILLAILLGIFLWRKGLKNTAWRLRAQYMLLRLPLLGYVIKVSNAARFSRTLSILSAAGVPMLEAMTIAAQLITSMPMRTAVLQAVQKVREGAAIYLALKQTTYFSPMSVHMVASGEASGELESMLSRVAQTEESDITRLIEVGLALFEPAVVLLMGAVVLFIVLAVLLPIFQLNQLV